MILLLKNFGSKPIFFASSFLTLKYILTVNRDVICLNRQFKKIVKKWIKLHNFIKLMKNPINLRKREIGLKII